MANNQQTHPRAIPLHLAHLIGLNIEFEVLVCLGSHCSKAVSGPGMDKHLRTYHGIKPKIRSQVNEYIKEFPFDYNYATIKLPRDGLAPQPWIPVVDGLHCKKCMYRTQRRDGIKKHGNKEHAMKRVQDHELFDRVKLQSWFRDGKERYWVVDESKQSGQLVQPGQSVTASQSSGNLDNGHGDYHEGSDSQEESDNQEEVDDQIARDLKQKAVAAKERRMVLLSKVPTDQLDPWLRYTEWNEVLQKSSHNIIETYRFTRKPDIDEPELIRILAAWERILNRCLDTLAANDHKDILKWWASPKNEIASQRPFELPQNARTITKYSGYFQQFIWYAMRTAPRTWEEESETGVKFTHQQWKKIERIRITCQTNVPEDSETDEKEQDQLLTTRLMGFCISVIRQDMGQLKVYDSPLMHFLAVMGVDSQTRSFKSSFLYTPVLAGILYINRLIMLESQNIEQHQGDGVYYQ